MSYSYAPTLIFSLSRSLSLTFLSFLLLLFDLFVVM